MNKRFMIASGGTGGHFYPGFALGQQMRKQGFWVLFIVRKNDPAIAVLKANKLHYKELDFMGFSRSLNPIKHIRFIGKLISSLLKMKKLIRQFNPHVAIGTGGYISFPLIFTAKFMGVKTAVHDSNARIGLANKICSKFTDLFMLGLPTNKKIKKSVLTSTPIRKEFLNKVNREEILTKLNIPTDKKVILVVGGSQGARGLNNAVIKLVKRFNNFHFVHITGEKWYQSILQEYGKQNNVTVLPYVHEIYNLMKTVDLVICRSGASTMAEILYCKIPSILVPYPYAAADHQYYNAKIFEQYGCAKIVRENDKLETNLQATFKNIAFKKMYTMKRSFARLHLPSPMLATKRIIKLLVDL